MKLIIRFFLLLSLVLVNNHVQACVTTYEDESSLLDLPLLHAQLNNADDQHASISTPSPLGTDESTYSTFTAENQSTSEDDDDSNPTGKALRPVFEPLFTITQPVTDYQATADRQHFPPSLNCAFISPPRYIVFRSIRI